MAIPDEFLYEYAVVRYVPRVDREEFINIGLIMMCKRRKWLRGEVSLNAGRILAFDSKADLKSLFMQASLFTCDDVPSQELPVEERYRWLSAVKSAVLQVSPSHPGLITDFSTEDNACNSQEAIERLQHEFNRLFTQLVL